MPMMTSQSDSSVTKATLTEGKITLNKDSNPTQTTAKALGINTSLSNANEQVENTLNLDRTLEEHQAIVSAVSNLQEATSYYMEERKREAEEALEKAAQQHGKDSQEYQTAKDAVEAWEIGGSKKQTVDTVTAIVGAVLGGGSAGQIGVAALLPTANNLIHTLTKDDKTQITNVLAHAVLGAIEAKASGINAASGAVAAAGAEIIANTIAKEFYGIDGINRTTDDLTDSEKQNILTLSQLGSAVLGGVTGDSGYAAAVSGEIGKRAVENNYLYRQEAEELLTLEQELLRTVDPEKRKKIQERIDELNSVDQERQEHIAKVCPAFGKSSAECSAAIADAEKAKASYNGSTRKYQPVGYTGQDNHPYSSIFGQDYERVTDALVGKDNATIQKEDLALGLAKSGNVSKEEAYRIIDSYMTLSDTLTALGGIKTVSNEKLLAILTGKLKLPTLGKTQGYDYGDVRISSGAENVALYQKLKDQLRQENLSNMVSNYPILEHAAFGKNNLTLKGTITAKEAESLARIWIGEKPILTSNGGMISADGTRRYRPPTIKSTSKYAETGMQANFERGYTDSSGKFFPESNLHLNIQKD